MSGLIQRIGDRSSCFPYTHIVDGDGLRTATLPITSALAFGNHIVSAVTVGMDRNDLELLVRETALVTSILRELVVLHPRCQHCDEKRGLAR